ncbi:hypothetical protein A9C11_17670 [Pseudomonas citronellolis]|uniref:Uncharacterized protein n=1 Tax=Pseudomonas citronellolis TaxID=53408 RepID=A0A1A9KFD1_9PSED|nr:hypothetical protein [Pseudomonas citronellolis]ANI15693.1 hypothetical protein A9C11_17670 [Pseudomonas citronellolis]
MNNKNNIDVAVVPTPAPALAAGRQPWLGLLGLAAVMLASLALIGCFSGETFASWVTFFVVCGVPVEIVLSMLWRNQYPGWLLSLRQPLRGLAQVGLTLAGAALIALLVFATQAQQVGPPTPFTLMYVIFCVLLTFWLVIAWDCWPLAAVLRHPLALGLGTLLLAYLLGYRLFTWLFDFSALAGAPFYRASLDPHGWVPAFDMLAFAVTTVSVLFACVLLEFWPLSRFPLLARQPGAGLARSALVLLLSAVLYGVGTRWLGIEPVRFMVHGAIALLFGALVPLLMFEGQLFAGSPQPLRGALQLGIAVLAGALLPRLYWAAAPWISGPMSAGAPGYAREFWLASALLAMTFPLLVVFSQFLDFWPLRRR